MANTFVPQDASGTITTGGTAQTALAAKNVYSYLFVQNPRAETETLRVDFGRTAVVDDAWELGPGDAVEFTSATGIPSGIVSVVAATTGHKFILKYAV